MSIQLAGGSWTFWGGKSGPRSEKVWESLIQSLNVMHVCIYVCASPVHCAVYINAFVYFVLCFFMHVCAHMCVFVYVRVSDYAPSSLPLHPSIQGVNTCTVSKCVHIQCPLYILYISVWVVCVVCVFLCMCVCDHMCVCVCAVLCICICLCCVCIWLSSFKLRHPSRVWMHILYVCMWAPLVLTYFSVFVCVCFCVCACVCSMCA